MGLPLEPQQSNQHHNFSIPTVFFETFCQHDDCKHRFPSITANWAVAVGSGVVQSEEDLEELITGGTTVSHLCHNSACRSPVHITLESERDNLSRQACVNANFCSCNLLIPCKLEHYKAQNQWLSHHQQQTSSTEPKLRKCPYPACKWVNPYDFSPTASQQPKHTQRLHSMPQQKVNRRPNFLTLIRQCEWLVLHCEHMHAD